jgi:alkylhydroperoxidase family enzyme
MLAASMARRLQEIEWGEPLIPIRDDPAWAAEIKRTFGERGRAYLHLAASSWIRNATLRITTGATSFASERQMMLTILVTSQENACRFCYGASRAYLKMLGLTEAELDRVERDVRTAGADDKERALLHFCRSLSRSNPRPARAELDGLVAMGFDPRALVEIAYVVALTCFNNRVSTFLALPISTEMEALEPGRLGRLAVSVKRALHRRPPPPPADYLPADKGPFFEIVALLKGTTGATVLHEAMLGAFASTVLPVRTKAWIFAVVARALDCHLSDEVAGRLLDAEGVSPAVRERILEALAGPELDATEAVLLPWVRETVHYQTEVMQRRTHELRARVGDNVALEAIGLASLANACARLSMLAQ